MPTAHKRKKQPEIIRQKLIECTARIIAEQGPGAVTLQAVSDAAGVTKGGLLHHFKNKNKLNEAVLHFLLDRIDADISRIMEQDPAEYGRFTRAYVNAISKDISTSQEEPWMSFAVYTLTEPQLKSIWTKWTEEKQKLYHDTDSDQKLQIIRYAADGIWFESLMGGGFRNEYAELFSKLIQMTYK